MLALLWTSWMQLGELTFKFFLLRSQLRIMIHNLIPSKLASSSLYLLCRDSIKWFTLSFMQYFTPKSSPCAKIILLVLQVHISVFDLVGGYFHLSRYYLSCALAKTHAYFNTNVPLHSRMHIFHYDLVNTRHMLS